MLENLLGNLFDKEQITHDTIQECLENLAQEMDCKCEDFFVMIKPTDNEFNMKFYVYKLENKAPKMVREITLKEILNKKD
jgi:galactitol-specific phosphotransferase system IIB component